MKLCLVVSTGACPPYRFFNKKTAFISFEEIMRHLLVVRKVAHVPHYFSKELHFQFEKMMKRPLIFY